ncbi:MAG: trypsin-like peptidase domain-containing protein [Rhodosalinus sp.]
MLRSLAAILILAAAPLVAETRVPSSQAEITLSFAPVVREAAPAVVNIYARRVVEARGPFDDDPFFREFFREFAPQRPRVQNSLGSGVILTADGYVVSNYHVVGRATDIRVVLNDRREFSADLVLADAEADLAILRLDGGGDLPHLPLRDSDTLEVGELVLAIGNPFGVGQTVSSGIISAVARSGPATGNLRGYFVQTDAPINPGNSGGALVDMAGRLVGVNTAILSRSGGSNGIGFAIPAALVDQFVEQAREGATRFERPWAGMSGQPVDADMAEALGLPAPRGMVVSDLHPQSPFAAAGVRAGDVVLDVDGAGVNGPAGMLYRLSIAGPGAEVATTIWREGRERALRLSLDPPPEDPPREALTLGPRSALPGLSLANVNPAVIAEMTLPLLDRGVVVTDPGPYGARAGLSAGDVILAVSGREVTRSREVAQALSTGGWHELVVQRGTRRVALRFRA